jgi:hypothetical protein
MLRCSMGWGKTCLGEWNWGRKIEAEPRGFESHSLLQSVPPVTLSAAVHAAKTRASGRCFCTDLEGAQAERRAEILSERRRLSGP